MQQQASRWSNIQLFLADKLWCYRVHLAKSIQHKGFGIQIYNEVIRVLNRDQILFGYKGVYNTFCEVNKPKRVDIVEQHIGFWNKNEYKRLKFDYIQPSLQDTQERVENLWLIVKCHNKKQSLQGIYIMSVIYDYMKLCMHIQNPYINSDFIQMQKQIQELDIVETCGLLE